MNLQSRKTTIKRVQEDGWGLRGTIAEELASDSPGFSVANVRLLRHHGVFQQDNRDERHRRRERALGRRYEFMVRIRATGGKLTARQMLGVLSLADVYCDGGVRITSRQGLQLGGIDKSALRAVMRRIAKLGLSTSATGGALNCNVMCCPAPDLHDPVHEQLQSAAQSISDQLTCRFPAYEEIWLGRRPSEQRETSGGNTTSQNANSFNGETILPHKFKVALATSQDNCTDVYSQDVGLFAVIDGGRIAGYNMLVGGGMGMILGVKDRLPALARPMAFVSCDDLLPLVSAVMCVYQQFGDRSDRTKARMRYLIQDWGLDRFKRVVAERFGRPLESPHRVEVVGYEDHLDWQQQGNGNWYLGIHVDLGSIRDTDQLCLKSALREIVDRFGCNFRLTPQQNILVCDIKPAERREIESVLARYEVPSVGSLSNVRRFAMACPGLPKCASAITNSGRALSGLVDALETEVQRLGLTDIRFTIRATGCPIGCTRAYLADIALVGRTIDRRTRQGKFSIFVGGDTLGRRLNVLYQDLVPADQIVSTLRPLLQYYRIDRHPAESLGCFCCRKGIDDLKRFANKAASEDAMQAHHARPRRVTGDSC
jgi:sulfite reductase (ferredoxin)